MSFFGMPKGMSKAAYSGTLKCPRPKRVGNNLIMGEECGSTSLRYVEHVSPFRIRYRCRKCGGTLQYDISNRLDHPYVPFKKSKWLQYVEGWEVIKGRRIKLKTQGVIQ